MIFSADWFVRHQRLLLVLLNLPIIGQVLRRALWIPERETKWRPITLIAPDAVHVWTGRRKRRAVLYSNPQYAEGLHRSFGWIWKTMHAWDMAVANPLRQPGLNLGFDTYDEQPDGTAGKDSFINQGAATTNFGTHASLEVGEWSGGVSLSRSIIEFDFSTIPTGSIISSVTASLWISTDDATTNLTQRWYRLKRAWVEAEVTWNEYSSGNSWQTAGAGGANDRDSSDSGRKTIAHTATGEVQWTDWDIDEIEAMVGAGPAWTNNGFLIKDDLESNHRWIYKSSDNATAAERPKMVIEYTPPPFLGAAVIETGGAAVPLAVSYRVFASSVPRTTFISNDEE